MPVPKTLPVPEVDACAQCAKPAAICVCDKVVKLATQHDILILQHPQEPDVKIGSVPLLLSSLPRARRVIGLSWPSLKAAVAAAWKDEAAPSTASHRHWAVLYPSSLRKPLPARLATAPFVALDSSGTPQEPDVVRGIVVLDGTWSQAKTLWWRNPWFLKLGRLIVHPAEPSIYGRARREPKREYVSTLEAVALTLDGLGEDAATGVQLRRLLRTMVQRARDAEVKKPSVAKRRRG